MKKGSPVVIFMFWLCLFSLHLQAGQPGNQTFWANDAGTAAQRFELAKRSTPELIAFMRVMPKGADLHIHPGGSSYSEFIIEQAIKYGMNYNKKRHTFTRESIEKEDIISIEALKRNPELLYEFLNRASMRGFFAATTNGHDHFFKAFNHTRPARFNLIPLMVEIIQRNRYQNMQYLEVMTPSIPDALIIQMNKALSTIAAIDANTLESAYKSIKPILNNKKSKQLIKTYLDQRDKKLMAALNEASPGTGNDGRLVFRFVHPVSRIAGTKQFFVQALAGMLVVKTDPRVVAINMLAPEDWPASRLQFEIQMAILDFLWQKTGQPNITLHAGELVLRDSPVEPMRNRIRMTIEKGHASRIGHGVSIAWEYDLADLLDKMKNQGIMLEVCLSSNEGILGVARRDHPFMMYRRAGVPVCINTDDEGVNRSNITMEFVKAIQDFDLSYSDIKELIRNSLEYSFLSGMSLYINRDYNRLLPGFEAVRSPDWQPGKKAEKLMKKNPKLNRQVILERGFVQFEKNLSNGFREH